ncbi:protein kinase STUNTED-like isoform X1 [Rosa rugosa]|uniref:protein kinase STUNTED-like isoform X1 n=1 Tax=Rosa rugosa TaxID=74645 RepID=UPI002B402523|nr:protein kinase STUNTED-like isoform X1 [Rosa rugosa]
MVRSHTIEPQMLSCRCKTVKTKRTIIAGLNSDTCSREMLLGLLTSVVKPEDNVMAIHVEETDDTFDPNTFHIHEDLCKSKKVDFQIKVCIGDSYISELAYQVRVSYATILALGCSSSGLNVSATSACLKGLPPSCTLLVMNSVGRILFQREGTCQQGSVKVALPLKSSQSFSSVYTCYNQSNTNRQLHKSLTIPSAPPVSSIRRITRRALSSAHKTVEVSDFVAQKLFHRLGLLEAEGSSRHFASQELRYATNNFSSDMVIGEGGHSKVYRATLEDGRAAAVKVLKTTHHSVSDLFREVDFLSSMNHKNIVQIIGFCDSGEMLAIVYDLLHGSLRRNLRQLRWSERMKVAIGVAKALEYLHHSHNPPIIHRDVKSSNILLSHDCEPILSDFGAAMVLRQSQHADAPFDVVGTFGYLAPEYMMYGKVDEKIDVYSYGVVLLELITGKEAIQTDQEIRESLVLWSLFIDLQARSLLSCGICERLIDPYLSEDYNKEEMEVMMVAARLCLMHSSSRRPTMKTILRLFEEPDHWLRMQRERDEFLKGTTLKDDSALF